MIGLVIVLAVFIGALIGARSNRMSDRAVVWSILLVSLSLSTLAAIGGRG